MPTTDEVQFKIQKMLQGWLGSVTIDEDGDFRFPVDSTIGFGRVLDWNGEDFVFNVWAPVLHEVPITNELCHYVATEFFVLGNLAIQEDDSQRTGRLDFQYRILANDIDQSELQAAISAVVGTADDLDDKLQRRFGGKRTADL